MLCSHHLRIRSSATAEWVCEAVVISVVTAEACRCVTPMGMFHVLLTT
jgi:hypothetical protein